MNTYTLARPEHQPLQPNPHDHCSSSYDSSESYTSTPSESSSRTSSLSIEGTLPLTPEATNSNADGFVFPDLDPTNTNPTTNTTSNKPNMLLMHQPQPTILHPPHPHSSPRFGRAQPRVHDENQLNRVKLQEMMNLIERQREESRRDDEAEEEEEEEDEDEEEEESTVCVNIVMTVKPEWIDEVKFLIKSGKKWAESHEGGLLTFRATVGVDNPCEIRLFQEFANLDAYRDHESNPFNQEMVNGLADYLEEDMVFIEGEEFAL